MNFNPWHSVSYGENVPDVVTAVIEIPKNSRAKYELDKETGMLRSIAYYTHPFITPQIMVLYHALIAMTMIRSIFLYCHK